MIRRLLLSLLLVLFSLPLLANDVVLNPDHPQRYEVVKGDTLWDISGRFLKFPWHWPDIWHVNAQIENPHLIYPGDIISLIYRDGKPILELTRGPKAYKMSPEVREMVLEKAIPTIPLSAIQPFLTRPRVVGEEVLDQAPYIVASSDERLISGAGDRVYARGIDETQGEHYSVFRGGKAYVDPETEEILGYEAIYTGDAFVEQMGDPATVELRYTNREVRIGDRLLAVEDENYDLNFLPRPLEAELEGRIISVFDGVSQVGQYQIVVLNRGARDGLEIGHVLSIYQTGDTVKDVVLAGTFEEDYFNTKTSKEDMHATVTLPDEFAGVAMVFKIFEKVSYAIIMKAKKAIHVSDKVSSNLDVARSIRAKRTLRLNDSDKTLAE
ncbi:MAG: LysM peptidoglycan-binding domain-containing protein [Proteobacteria bacterium]|nr:LysM peptidoglycan-binding domain-containing protein [Pseudomonadota bacterium]